MLNKFKLSYFVIVFMSMRETAGEGRKGRGEEGRAGKGTEGEQGTERGRFNFEIIM